MHIPPEIWGPIFWSTLHIVSLAYPDTPSYPEKRAAKELYNSMSLLLPCPVCRKHYTAILQAMPIDNWLDNRTSLVEWVWKAHNQVNIQLEKPEISLSEFHAKYKQMADRGLPYPPAGPQAELADAAIGAAYAQGAFHALMALTAAGVVGGLLWASYK
jgi:hypothetical protein